jgi:hypothetical protein
VSMCDCEVLINGANEMCVPCTINEAFNLCL